MNSKKLWQCPPEKDQASNVRLRCSKLNAHLSQAFRCGNIIEIFGEAGTAKTQLCLDLALQTTAHSAIGRVLYISTDRNFPTRRMQQLLEYTDLSSDHLDRIIVKTVFDGPAFFTVLESNIPDLAKTFKLDLIIIDSIVGALRSEFEHDKREKRVQAIHKLGTLLHAISRKLQIPIIVTNQVTALIDQKMQNFGREFLPCLGLGWSCYVHTRIFVGKTGKTVESDQLNVSKKLKVETSVRIVQVDFSPVLPNICTNFIVDNSGVRSITIKDST